MPYRTLWLSFLCLMYPAMTLFAQSRELYNVSKNIKIQIFPKNIKKYIQPVDLSGGRPWEIVRSHPPHFSYYFDLYTELSSKELVEKIITQSIPEDFRFPIVAKYHIEFSVISDSEIVASTKNQNTIIQLHAKRTALADKSIWIVSIINYKIGFNGRGFTATMNSLIEKSIEGCRNAFPSFFSEPRIPIFPGGAEIASLETVAGLMIEKLCKTNSIDKLKNYKATELKDAICSRDDYRSMLLDFGIIDETGWVSSYLIRNGRSSSYSEQLLLLAMIERLNNRRVIESVLIRKIPKHPRSPEKK